MAVGPREEARQRRLLACPGRRRQVGDGSEEAAQGLGGDRRGGAVVEADEAGQIGAVGAMRVGRAVGVSEVAEEVRDEAVE